MPTANFPTDRLRRNMVLDGRRTTVNIETVVWEALTEICRREEISLDELCELAASRWPGGSVASALRVTCLEYFRAVCDPSRKGTKIGQRFADWLTAMEPSQPAPPRRRRTA